jgi:hypothetical protein
MSCATLASHPYRGLWAAIATMHGKEHAIAPPFCKWFEMTITNAPGIDTDALGTFTGEIARQGTMLEAARAKAMLAIERTGAPLGIGSEGAFGPDPYVPFVASGREVLVLREAATGHEIVNHRRTRTNFDHVIASETDNIDRFLARVGFPEHAVIVRPENHDDTSVLVKGLKDRASVRDAVREVATRSGSERIMLQTDMRAHLNPTRMAAIGRVARLLGVRAARCCPSCETPGFGITDVARGLPCADCGLPTALVRAKIYGCKACGLTTRRFERTDRMRAEARWCQFCNP